MTHYTPADLDMADRHIAEGERHIVRQEQIIAGLRLAGHSTAVAEDLLRQFQEALVSHQRHRDAIAIAIDQSRNKPAAW